MDILTLTKEAFEMEFSGDRSPIILRPGPDGVGATIKSWASPGDEEIFSDMYPSLRPGLVVAQINGFDSIFLSYLLMLLLAVMSLPIMLANSGGIRSMKRQSLNPSVLVSTTLGNCGSTSCNVGEKW